MNTKGKNILEARKNAGLTMEELGKMQNDAVEIFDNILKSAIM